MDVRATDDGHAAPASALAALERALAASPARTVLADARLVRRVIKRHRHLPGIGLQVPHARCYGLPRDELLRIVDARELGRAAGDLPEDVILLPRSEPDEIAGEPLPDLLAAAWRYAFHARVHLAIDRLARGGALTPARVRERIHRVGQTEFDEIRLVLKQDGMLLEPRSDLETYTEFAALYLELSTFAPDLLAEIFPTLADGLAVRAALAEDLDVARLLEEARPHGATFTHRPVAAGRARASGASDAGPASAPASGEARALLDLADAARAKGNHARSALLRVRAGDPDGAREDAKDLALALDRALGPAPFADAGAASRDAWEAAILSLAEHAAARGDVFRLVSARLLYDVQRAAMAGGKAIGKVDVVDFVLSLGRRPLVRLLPATREIRVARELATGAAKVSRAELPEADEARLHELFADARRRADAAIRRELAPRIEGTLKDVDLVPTNVPERVARDKLVAELVDQAAARGHTSLGQLRDAISRNQLKVPDLAGAGALVFGDPLLSADRRLANAIDGVHRRGEIYLRLLQKLSSLLFGTRPGRFATMFLILPLGGAYMLPFATGLVVTEIAHLAHLWPHHRHLHLVPSPERLGQATHGEIALMATIGVLLFGLLHSGAVRAATVAVLRAIGAVLSAVFVRAPRWVLAQPAVARLLRSRAVLALGRFVARPGLVTAAVLAATPVRQAPPAVALPIVGAVFLATALALNSRAGIAAVEIVEDAAARMLRQVERHLLPGLLRLVESVFRRLTDAIDRGIYTVDEKLRFREGQPSWALASKAVLGLFWFAIAYVLRIYVNLLLEPTFNPIKHVPTVTVAAKIMLPVDRDLATTLVGALRPVVGHSFARVLAGLTVVSLPGFFGFLVWELKENYKLYRATRAETLRPVIIGHHGETMGALMKPGLHSGTLPKLWHKLRRAARRGDPSLEKHREAMREIEEAVERFVDRELGALLGASPRFQGAVHVTRVALASNRVRVELARVPEASDAGARHHEHAAHEAEACAIAFEEQSGFLVAGIAQAGWTAHLAGVERVLVENALAGLYHRAGVDLVREQIEAALPDTSRYDVADEGLVVWPAGFATEIVYPLDAKPELAPRVRGDAGTTAARPLPRAAIIFREQSIAWKAWVEAWETDAPARLATGASLLPRAAEAAGVTSRTAGTL